LPGTKGGGEPDRQLLGETRHEAVKKGKTHETTKTRLGRQDQHQNTSKGKKKYDRLWVRKGTRRGSTHTLGPRKVLDQISHTPHITQTKRGGWMGNTTRKP